MRSTFCPGHAGVLAPKRIVCLPGAYHGARDFLDAGFEKAVRARQLRLDLTFVDLELQHLADRSVLEKLRSEAILPPRGLGVQVWLAGISLGGLLALHYAAAYPQELAGLCLLAPYLGNRMLTAEIAASGLAAWDCGELAEGEVGQGELAQGDEERGIWRYLRTRPNSPLYLGYGRKDRFAAAHELLAQVVPADSVHVIDGAHDWPTWTRLWENFLDSRFA